MSDYPHIHPEHLHIMETSDADRIQFLRENRWIGYTRAKHILQQLDDLLTHPKKERMPNLLIIGESNNGKTTLARHFHTKHGAAYENSQLEIVLPIVYLEAPSTPNDKALYIALLEKLGAPYRSSRPAEELYNQCKHLLFTYHVSMLMIDEFHSMFSGTALKQREMMMVLKRLCNELRIPIVGIGTQSAVNILHTDKQFASRFEVTELENWPLNMDLH